MTEVSNENIIINTNTEDMFSNSKYINSQIIDSISYIMICETHKKFGESEKYVEENEAKQKFLKDNTSSIIEIVNFIFHNGETMIDELLNHLKKFDRASLNQILYKLELYNVVEQKSIRVDAQRRYYYIFNYKKFFNALQNAKNYVRKMLNDNLKSIEEFPFICPKCNSLFSYETMIAYNNVCNCNSKNNILIPLEESKYYNDLQRNIKRDFKKLERIKLPTYLKKERD